MSLSLLQESSLDTEFAFHIRHQNAFLSHLCCYCEDVGFRSPVEGAPNFKMGASGVQEIPIWVVVAEQGDCASRGVEEVRSQWSLVPLPARRSFLSLCTQKKHTSIDTEAHTPPHQYSHPLISNMWRLSFGKLPRAWIFNQAKQIMVKRKYRYNSQWPDWHWGIAHDLKKEQFFWVL